MPFNLIGLHYICSSAIACTNWNVSKFKVLNYRIPNIIPKIAICLRIYGAYFDDEGLQVSLLGQTALMSKSMEGIVESGPQLVLQLYIIARNGIGREIENGIDMSMGGQYDPPGKYLIQFDNSGFFTDYHKTIARIRLNALTQ